MRTSDWSSDVCSSDLKKPVRIGTTSLLTFQRNGYSVQCEHDRALARLRIYPFELVMEVGNAVIARHCRSFELPPGSPRMAQLRRAGPEQARDSAFRRTVPHHAPTPPLRAPSPHPQPPPN